MSCQTSWLEPAHGSTIFVGSREKQRLTYARCPPRIMVGETGEPVPHLQRHATGRRRELQRIFHPHAFCPQPDVEPVEPVEKSPAVDDAGIRVIDQERAGAGA